MSTKIKRYFSPLHSVQTGSGALHGHGCFPGGEADRSSTSSYEVQNDAAIPHSLWVVVWCLHRCEGARRLIWCAHSASYCSLSVRKFCETSLPRLKNRVALLKICSIPNPNSLRRVHVPVNRLATAGMKSPLNNDVSKQTLHGWHALRHVGPWPAPWGWNQCTASPGVLI
jgi:hypothetical protein